jgi:hypothetical protein
MTSDKRLKSLISLGLTLLATILIAATLPRLELQPGIPLPAWESQTQALPTETEMFPLISVNTFIRALLGILLASAFLYSLYKVIRGASWKEVLRSFRYVAILGLVILVVSVILFALLHLPVTTLPSVPEILPPALAIKGPKLAPLPPSLIWLVWIGLGLVTGLLIVWILRWQGQRRRSQDALAWEAERALQALKSGEGFKNVIVRCYREMGLVLQRERGIELEQSMTAQEFECLLEARGIPHAPIDQLTRLFEAARYGYRPPTQDNEQTAFDCLNVIVHHLREEKKIHS